MIGKFWLGLASNFNCLHLKSIGYLRESVNVDVHSSFTKLNNISDGEQNMWALDRLLWRSQTRSCTSVYNLSCLKMSDSFTSEYTHATSASNIPGFRCLQFPDHHLPLHDPSWSSDQPPAISIPIVNPPDHLSNLSVDHSTDTSEFLYGPSGSPVSSDSGDLLLTTPML